MSEPEGEEKLIGWTYRKKLQTYKQFEIDMSI